MISRGACLHYAEHLYAAARQYDWYEERSSCFAFRRSAMMHRMAADMYRAAGLRQYVGEAAEGAPDDPSSPAPEERA